MTADQLRWTQGRDSSLMDRGRNGRTRPMMLGIVVVHVLMLVGIVVGASSAFVPERSDIRRGVAESLRSKESELGPFGGLVIEQIASNDNPVLADAISQQLRDDQRPQARRFAVACAVVAVLWTVALIFVFRRLTN
jgi:ABC-type uncharacterized transport system substrate-binding protein